MTGPVTIITCTTMVMHYSMLTARLTCHINRPLLSSNTLQHRNSSLYIAFPLRYHTKTWRGRFKNCIGLVLFLLKLVVYSHCLLKKSSSCRTHSIPHDASQRNYCSFKQVYSRTGSRLLSVSGHQRSYSDNTHWKFYAYLQSEFRWCCTMVAALPKLERERFANCMKMLSAFFTNVL